MVVKALRLQSVHELLTIVLSAPKSAVGRSSFSFEHYNSPNVATLTATLLRRCLFQEDRVFADAAPARHALWRAGEIPW